MCILQVFTKVGVEEELMRRATELKKSLEYALRKHERLHIDYKNRERRVVSLFFQTDIGLHFFALILRVKE